MTSFSPSYILSPQGRGRTVRPPYTIAIQLFIAQEFLCPILKFYRKCVSVLWRELEQHLLCPVADKYSTCSSSKEPPKLALWPLYLQTARNSKLERGGVRCSYSVAKFQNLNQVSARMNLSSPLGGLRTRAGPNPPLPNRTNQKC